MSPKIYNIVMYSETIRNIALKLKNEFSLRKLSQIVGVSKSCLQRWFTKRTQIRTTEQRIWKNELDCLKQIVHQNPFQSIRKYTKDMSSNGFTLSHVTTYRLLKLLGYSYKKTKPLASIKNHEEITQRRLDFECRRSTIDICSVISIDETSFYHSFSSKFAWSPKKQYVHVPQQKLQGKRCNLISALSSQKIVYQMIVEGACNTETFLEFLKYLPVESQHRFVLMDNVSFHRSSSVKQAIESKSLQSLYLAPYSPDYNPIEMYFGWMKNGMRRGLQLGTLVPSTNLCSKWFKHAFEFSYFT